MDNDNMYDITSTPASFLNSWDTMICPDEDQLEFTSINYNNTLYESTYAIPATDFFGEGEIIEVAGNDCPPALLENFAIKTEDIETISAPLDESLNMVSVPASLPARENWSGDFGFDVTVGKIIAKNGTYSSAHDKLYINKDAACPINFSTVCSMPKGAHIRAAVLYSSPESATELVARCQNHRNADENKCIKEAEHLVRCESPMAVYEKNLATNLLSVRVPFENPPVGQSFSTYIYKFTCLGSCLGIGRRPLMLVFTLEKDNEVLGRKKLNLKICAMPQRDKNADEQKVLKTVDGTSKKRKMKLEPDALPSSSSVQLSTKKVKIAPNQNGYNIKVEDNKCYEFLKRMKEYYEIVNTMKNLPPDAKAVLEKYKKRKGYVNPPLGIPDQDN